MALKLYGTPAGTLLMRIAAEGKAASEFAITDAEAEACQQLLEAQYAISSDHGYRLTYDGAVALVELVDRLRNVPASNSDL
jgi:hypothetical protein